MDFPGHIIKLGETDKAIVTAIVTALRQRGIDVPTKSVGFDAGLKGAVKLFQAQHHDAQNRPLQIDGTVGPLTWAALFGAKASPPATGAAALALAVAVTQIGEMEDPVGSNRGQQVDAYQIAAGLTLPAAGKPGFFWCMAFVHWCFATATTEAGIANPFPRTAGCLDAWNKVKRATPNRLISRQQAIASPAIVKPGMVFILDFGGSAGHTGFVTDNIGGALRTIEGNSNPDGSRNGIGVFELNRRKVTEASLKGFIDFT